MSVLYGVYIRGGGLIERVDRSSRGSRWPAVYDGVVVVVNRIDGFFFVVEVVVMGIL